MGRVSYRVGKRPFSLQLMRAIPVQPHNVAPWTLKREIDVD
jgi:hypothetical protein